MVSRETNTGYQAPAVKRAFELLRMVAESREGMGVSELAKRLGYSKSSTHGLIQALINSGALAESPHRKCYFLGPALVELAFRSRNYLRVREQAQPVLEDLRDRIGETVFLGVLSRTRGIIVAVAEAAKPLKISSPPGTSIPLLAGAVGKVFLAQLAPRDARRLIREHGLRPFTPRSIVSEDVYLKGLSAVRELGYAVDNEEYLPGVKAVAVSLGNHRGLPLAIWVVGFAGTLTDAVVADIVQHTCAAADRLRSLLDADS